MDTGTLFNKIWVIESLRGNDFKTGQELYHDTLIHIAASEPDLEVELAQPETANELFTVLDRVKLEAEEGKYPFLHFECHGCPDGLETTTGEFITWPNLRDALIEINKASRLNTVILVGACNGIHLIKVSIRLDRAPYWAVIGPEDELYPDQIRRDFAAFYSTFFDSLNGDDAIRALNCGVVGADRTYHFHTSVGLFKRAYIAYHRDHCRGRGKQARVEELITEAMKDTNCKKLGVNEVRRRIKAALAKEDEHFHRKKREFFFIDLYPENAQRFTISYDDVLSSLPS